MVFGIKRLIRRFVRRQMNPISVDKAELWKRRFSFIYMLVGWNMFGFMVYYLATGRRDWAQYYGLKTDEELSKRPGEYYAQLLGMKNVTIITVEGFKKVGEYEYKGEDNEDDKDDKKKKWL